MRTWMCFIIVLFMLGVSDRTASADSPIIEDPATEHSYVRLDSPLTWQEAKTHCESVDGSLATLTSQEENDFVWTQIGVGGISIWLGGTDEAEEGTWMWVTGETWAYSNWDTGQPDNGPGDQHYLSFSAAADNRWDDDVGSAAYAFICEWEPALDEEMVRVSPGCFSMGDPFQEGLPDELPVHNVCVSAFEMDIHEVTNAQYRDCVDAGVCAAPVHAGSHTRSTYYGDPAYDSYPVIHVTWTQASDYCTWAEKRLPTEAEWEFAARGGLADKRYPWGDTITCDDANYGRLSPPDTCWDHNGLENDTHQAGAYGPNGHGLYDMAGNVLEWVHDWHNLEYYEYCVDEGVTNDPTGPTTGSQRVLRGGSWYLSSFYARVASRERFTPGKDEVYVGFRCARSGSCLDNDHDGYGNPEDTDCISPDLDCDDADADVHPGATELCDNEIDDDCDSLVDVADDDCACVDNDGDGYGETATPACPYPQRDCDDDPSDDPPECTTCTCGQAICAPCARCINPGEYEGPLGDHTCFDGLDNDCDERIDDPYDRGCQQLEWSISSQADASGYGPDLPTKSRTSNLLAILLLAMSTILFLKFVHRKKV